MNLMGSGNGAAAAPLLLYGEYVAHIVGAVTLVPLHSLQQHEAAHPVVKGLGADTAVLQLVPGTHKTGVIAYLDVLFGVLLAGASDVNVQLAAVVLGVLDLAVAAHHADDAVLEHHLIVVQGGGPDPAHAAHLDAAV